MHCTLVTGYALSHTFHTLAQVLCFQPVCFLCITLFAATGHNNYAKCARLYLQMMADLPSTHPWLYEMFVTNGYHTVRRSDRFWGGLSTDLLIEQTLMKTMKGRGGLTRGRGIHESVRSIWVNSMHQCASIHLAMTVKTGLHTADQQHADIGNTHALRDFNDTNKVITWFESECHNPFNELNGTLRCLSTGATATDGDNISCDVAETVGAKIQAQLDSRKFGDITMKKADQIRR